MQPRSRIRGRGPPPSGGRYRRRSPPPPSPRHKRLPRDPPPPQSQRRSPDLPPPRRYEENHLPGGSAVCGRSRADILLEAGRLAAHYLVAKGVLPEDILRVREDPKRNPVSRPEPPVPAPGPAPASYVRKRGEDDGPRWGRSGGGAGVWGRGKGDDDRQVRRSGWDSRSNSFDGRRKHNDGGSGGDVDLGVGGRRTRDYDEPKRRPMSRSYSHNDRRASVDGRVDRRRRSRSRSRSRSRTRTRTRSDYGGSRRDSEWRAGSRDLDHTKVPDSGIIPAAAGDGDVHYADGDEMPRQPKVPSSVVVAEVNDSAGQAMAIEDGLMESEIIGLDHAQNISEDEDGEFAEGISEDEDGEFAEDISEDEDGEFAVTGLNDEDGGEVDVSQRQLSDVDVHPSESVEEPMHMQPQLSNVEDKNETGTARMDACMVEPLADNNGCSEVSYEMEAPLGEVETGVGDLNRDEQELPAWYRIFDLNAVETPEGCEMSKISGGPPAEHVSDYAPDLLGRMNEQANYDTSQTQGQDGHAGSNHLLEDGHDLNNCDLNNEADEHAQDDTLEIQGQDEHAGDNHLLEDGHDLIKYDLNNEADEQAQDNHLLSNEELLLNHGMAVHHLDNCHLSNEQMLLKQIADEQEHDHQENKRMLINQGTIVQGLDSHHVNDERLLLSHGADEHQDEYHRMEQEPMPFPLGVHDLDSYDLKSEEILLNKGEDQHAADICHLKDGQILLDLVADGEGRVHNMGNGRTIPVIDLEDDYEEQSDTRDTGSDISHKYTDNVLQKHTCSQDQQTSSFPDNPQTTKQAASSSSVTPKFGMETGVLEGVL
ncbi:uncharacterized protein LOC133931284 [Phragmites australis]|uniref:uncharacterized protein LOC133931284 n=1 Tax=Phragmites australis TaxID=29695 RepID=UPI002D79A689|nr:uncharacterized protein LOC133931284 [Phragmites australis]